MDLLDFETVADASAATAGDSAGGDPSSTADPEAAPDGGEAVSSPAATDTAPAWSPPDDPAFQDFVDQRAAEIAQAQVQPILGLLQQLANPAADGGETQAGRFDWSNVDVFDGSQLGQGVAATVQEALAPVYDFMRQMQHGQQSMTQQQEAREADQAASSWIETNAGDLPAAAKELIRPLAQHFFPAFEAMYGPTDRAGDAAFRKAVEHLKQIGGAPAPDTSHLAEIAAARTDLTGGGGGSGIVTLPDEPLSARERVLKYAPKIQAAR